MQTTEVSSQEGNSPPLVPGRQLLTSSLTLSTPFPLLIPFVSGGPSGEDDRGSSE